MRKGGEARCSVISSRTRRAGHAAESVFLYYYQSMGSGWGGRAVFVPVARGKFYGASGQTERGFRFQ